MLLLNNKFLRTIKNFEKKIYEQSLGEMTMEDLRKIINEAGLKAAISRIERQALTALCKKYKAKIKQQMLANPDFLAKDFPALFSSLLKKYSDKLIVIEAGITRNTIMEKLIEKMCLYYIANFVDFAPKINAKNVKKVEEKIKIDIKSFEKTLQALQIANHSAYVTRLTKLQQYLATDDVDVCVVQIIGISALYVKIFSGNNLEKIISAKVFFPPYAISYVRDHLNHLVK